MLACYSLDNYVNFVKLANSNNPCHKGHIPINLYIYIRRYHSVICGETEAPRVHCSSCAHLLS